MKLYENYISENGLDIYRSKLQNLPTPQYIVFYNGKANEADERILRLSDAFVKKGGCLECEARMLNINYGHNRELMEKCQRLKEYAIFISRVRKYASDKEISLKQAIARAMDECIQEGILVDILTKQRDEVFGVLLSTFNQELYEKNLKEDAFEDGKIEGKIETYLELIKEGILTISDVAERLEISEEEVERLRKTFG